MKKWEYCRIRLSHLGKWLSVVQYAKGGNVFLSKEKSAFKKLDINSLFSSLPAQMGMDGWELTSVSNHVESVSRTGSFSVSEGYEPTTAIEDFWFKRELGESKMPDIKKSLEDFFK